jgi:hypothetical protein
MLSLMVSKTGSSSSVGRREKMALFANISSFISKAIEKRMFKKLRRGKDGEAQMLSRPNNVVYLSCGGLVL